MRIERRRHPWVLLVAALVLAVRTSSAKPCKWKSWYHQETPRTVTPPQHHATQQTFFERIQEAYFTSAPRARKEYGLAAGPVTRIYPEQDLFVAHRKSHNIWQIRGGRVKKIYGSVHGEAGHLNGVDLADSMDPKIDGTNSLRFDAPYDFYTDYLHQVLYVIEGKTRIRKMVFDSEGYVKMVTTLAGDNRRGHRDHPTNGGLARFGYPISMTGDSFGNLYVSDSSNHCIRKITHDLTVTGGYVLEAAVTTFLGVPGKCGSLNHALGSLALFQNPGPIITTNQGDLLVADNHTTIRRIVLNATDSTPDGSNNICSLPGHVNVSGDAINEHDLIQVSNRDLGGFCEAQSKSKGSDPSWPNERHTTRYAGHECALAIDGDPGPWVAHPSDQEPWFRLRFAKKSRLHMMGWHPFGEESEASAQSTWNYNKEDSLHAKHHPWRVQLEFGDGTYQLIQLIDNATTRNTVTYYTLQPVFTDTVIVRVRKLDPPRYYPAVPDHTSFRSTCDVAETRNATFQCADFQPVFDKPVLANHTVGAREVSFWGSDCLTMAHEVAAVSGTPGRPGLVDGRSSEGQIRFDMPTAMAIQRGREDVYVADYYNNVVRKIDIHGTVSTVHGQPQGDPWKVTGFGSPEQDKAHIRAPVGYFPLRSLLAVLASLTVD